MCKEYARMMRSSASSYGEQLLQSVPSLHHMLSTQTILYGLFNFFLIALSCTLCSLVQKQREGEGSRGKGRGAEERGGEGSRAIASQLLIVRMGKCCQNRIVLDYLTDRLNRIHRKLFTIHRIPYAVYRIQYIVYRIPYTVYRISYIVYRIPQQDTVALGLGTFTKSTHDCLHN